MIYDQIMVEFHSSQEVATLGLSLFVLGLAGGPMVVSPLSEVRRIIPSFQQMVDTDCSSMAANTST